MPSSPHLQRTLSRPNLHLKNWSRVTFQTVTTTTSTIMIGECERDDTLKMQGDGTISPYLLASETLSTRDTWRCDTWKRCCQSATTGTGSSVGIPHVPHLIHGILHPLLNTIQADTTLTLLVHLLDSMIGQEMTISMTESLSSEREGLSIDTVTPRPTTQFTACLVYDSHSWPLTDSLLAHAQACFVSYP